MPGTKAGAAKAMATIKEKYGDSFHAQIGSLGGRAKIPKGFALDPERAKIAGRKGGKISRRNGVSTGQGKEKEYYKVSKQILAAHEHRKNIGLAKGTEAKEAVEDAETVISTLQSESEQPDNESFFKRIFGRK